MYVRPEGSNSQLVFPRIVEFARSHAPNTWGDSHGWMRLTVIVALLIRAIMWCVERLLPFVQAIKVALEIWWVGALASMTVATTLQVALHGVFYGVTLTVMVAAHEYGHLYAFWRRGFVIPKIWFIPFVGAIMRFAARMRDPVRFNERYGLEYPDTAAYIGIWGPLAGTIVTAVAFTIWLSPAGEMIIASEFHEPFRMIMVGSALYNLIQLSLAVRPFDGGWITQAIHPWFRHYTAGMLALLTFLVHAAWVAHWWALFFYGIRFARSWRRLLMVGTVAFTMVTAMALGYGRATPIENAIDIAFMGIIVWWTVGLVKASGEPFHALPEWRALLWFFKKPTGRWKDRTIDGHDSGLTDDERRLAAALRVPTDIVPHVPWSGDDRRGTAAIPLFIRLKWAACYILLLGYLYGMLWMLLLLAP